MQFGGAPNNAIFKEGDDRRAVIGAYFGVALNEAVVHEAMETIAAAVAVEPQQVIAQQRQFFLLAQRAHAGVGERGRNMGEIHVLNSSERSPRGGVESLDQQYCATQHRIQGPDDPYPASNNGSISSDLMALLLTNC